jgi:hypothetical protein
LSKINCSDIVRQYLKFRENNIFRIFDELFDRQNSKNPFGQNSKEAMKIENKESWLTFLQKAGRYIKSLSDSNGIKLLAGRRKTGFLGFLSNISAYQNMFEQLVEGGHLKYLLTYKTSQDHLELFFGAIRSRHGCNDNPTPDQFSSAYKRLLLHGTSKGEY